jgi:hypothetical protein
MKSVRPIQAVAALLVGFLGGPIHAADEASRPARAVQRPAGPVPRFTPEERQKRRLQIKERLSRQVSELEKRKAAGTITDEERKRLQRLEILATRFQRRAPDASSNRVVGASPNPSVNEKKQTETNK